MRRALQLPGWTGLSVAFGAVGALAALLAQACAGQPHASRTLYRATSAPPTAACRAAAASRKRVPSLLAEGRLARAVRVIQAADEACPASSPDSRAQLASALSELEMRGEASGEALLALARKEESAGAAAAAQRWYDRAAVALANESGAQPEARLLDAPHDTLAIEQQQRLVILQPDCVRVFVAPAYEERLHFSLPDVTPGRPPAGELSADGRYLALRPFSGLDISVWDLDKQEQVATLRDHAPVPPSEAERAVVPLAVGERFLAWSNTATVHLWELSTERALGDLLGHAEPPKALWLRERDDTLVSVAASELLIWDLKTRRTRAKIHLVAADRRVEPLPFGEHFVAFVGKAGEVGVVDLLTGTSSRVTRVAGVTSLAASPDGKRLAIATPLSTIEVWELSPRLRLLRRVQLPHPTRDLASASAWELVLGPDARTLAVRLNSGNSAVIDLAQGALEMLPDAAYGATPHGLFYFEPQGEQRTAVYPISQGRRGQPVLLPTALATSRLPAAVHADYAVSSDGARVAVTADHGKLLLLDSQTWAVQQFLDSAGGWDRPRFSVPFFLSGDRGLLWQGRETVRLFDLKAGRQATPVVAEAARVAWQGAGEETTLLAIHADGTLRTWPLDQPQPSRVKRVLPMLLGYARNNEAVPSSTMLADATSLGRSGQVLYTGDQAVAQPDLFQLYDARSGTRLIEAPRPPCGIVLSDDGAQYALAGDGKLEVYATSSHQLLASASMAQAGEWGPPPCPEQLAKGGAVVAMRNGYFDETLVEVATGKVLADYNWQDSLQPEAAFAVSEDGARAALAVQTRLRVYAAGRTEPLYDAEVSSQPVRWLRFSRDANQLMIGLQGGAAAQVRAVPSGALRATIEHHGQPLTWPDFSPNGQYIADAVAGRIVLWKADGGKELAALTALYPATGALVTVPTGEVDFASDPREPVPLSCQVGGRVFPFALCRERWHVPGLLKQVMSGDQSYAQP
jgi:WD40 repeat protein